MNNHTSAELFKLAKSEKDARKKIRYLAVAHFLDNHNRTQIAGMLNVSRRIVNEWVKRYLNEGVTGLETKKPPGKRCYLNDAQQKQLCQYIERYSKNDNGGRLTGYRIKQYIETEFNVSYHPNAIYKLLKHLGFSWITSRSRHPKQSEQVQQDFKKTANGIDQNDPIIYQPE